MGLKAHGEAALSRRSILPEGSDSRWDWLRGSEAGASCEGHLPQIRSDVGRLGVFYGAEPRLGPPDSFQCTRLSLRAIAGGRLAHFHAPAMTSLINPRSFGWLCAALFGATLFGCSGSGSGSTSFTLHETTQSIASTTVPELSGVLFAFLADEATFGAGGTDLNGDADVIDSVAVVVNTSNQVETELGVAALELEWVGDDLFLIVNETLDGRNWDANPALTSNVLLHWVQGMALPELVATVPATNLPRMVAVSTRLYYHNVTTPVGAFQSNLFFVDAAAPTVPVPVTTQDATAELSVQILGAEGGLLSCVLDETVEGRDLNNDTDMTDTSVLALLDANDVAGILRNVALAVPAASPVRALSTGTNDWLVAFLVDEADQGATNFNDPLLFAASWKPAQCAGFEDADTLDDVLHYLNFALWDMNPGVNPPINTGLVGDGRVVVIPGTAGFVGTLSLESDEGTCDLNGDGDTADRIFRYTQATTPTLPPGAQANMHAVAHMVPGGTFGVVELDTAFVVLVDEAADGEDHDGDAGNDFDLLAWVEPSDANLDAAYRFNHAATGPPLFFGATWMDDLFGRTRMMAAISEDVSGDLNGDLDALDSVPTFPDFVPGPRLNFSGATVAVDPTNPGALLIEGITYFRVLEVTDQRDWNNDGDIGDTVLIRLFESVGSPEYVSVLNNLPRPAVDFAPTETAPNAGVFVVQESMAGEDYNGDGDLGDFVLRYFSQ